MKARLFSLLLLSALAAAAAETAPELHWYKGNTHTHTLNSDGDSPVGTVTHWYRDQGYDFVVVSDHRYLTVLTELQREFDLEAGRLEKRKFLLVTGEEVDGDIMRPDGTRAKTVHFISVGPRVAVGKQAGDTVMGLGQTIADAIRGAGGLPILNHPNFHWSVTAADMLALRHVRHFELHNGHPAVHNLGGSGHPSTEELWDQVLSKGRIYYGVASDDAHHWLEWSRAKSNPGRAWIMVRAAELTSAAVVDALARGDFYGSTGIELIDVTASDGTLRLKIRQKAVVPDPRMATNFFGYKTWFIGKDGQVLKVDESMEPSYTLKPGDLYVRARVLSSAGDQAWTQPLFAAGQGRLE